jgi:hypothetical protein
LKKKKKKVKCHSIGKEDIALLVPTVYTNGLNIGTNRFANKGAHPHTQEAWVLSILDWFIIQLFFDAISTAIDETQLSNDQI